MTAAWYSACKRIIIIYTCNQNRGWTIQLYKCNIFTSPLIRKSSYLTIYYHHWVRGQGRFNCRRLHNDSTFFTQVPKYCHFLYAYTIQTSTGLYYNIQFKSTKYWLQKNVDISLVQRKSLTTPYSVHCRFPSDYSIHSWSAGWMGETSTDRASDCRAVIST